MTFYSFLFCFLVLVPSLLTTSVDSYLTETITGGRGGGFGAEICSKILIFNYKFLLYNPKSSILPKVGNNS